MKINIKGTIIKNNSKWIYDWLEMDSTCPNDVIKAIEEAKGEDIEVIINSGGGDVYSGSEIFTVLKEYKGNIKGKIVGIAGSAASVIAMGIKNLSISPTAQIMIHKASSYGSGNHKAFENMAEVLKSHDIGICNAYMLKTGMSQKDILEVMDKETYMDAKTALQYGFVDEIMFDEDLQLSANIQADIPPELINKIKNLLIKNGIKASDMDANFLPEIENRVDSPEPVSYIEPILTEKQKEFARIKNKLYGGMQK